ncbi:hypothetical protein EUX98_g8243 [Antrodiella citrinella]|uniref:Uncharacterized protein n=1 Tax=Antrodiella citrinella TaxID=2447956 RepID=A0A4S4MAD0_9APHY|nr:hypothetical protein EUX98_g8243 [Antrodiella citrinella]
MFSLLSESTDLEAIRSLDSMENSLRAYKDPASGQIQQPYVYHDLLPDKSQSYIKIVNTNIYIASHCVCLSLGSVVASVTKSASHLTVEVSNWSRMVEALPNVGYLSVTCDDYTRHGVPSTDSILKMLGYVDHDEPERETRSYMPHLRHLYFDSVHFHPTLRKDTESEFGDRPSFCDKLVSVYWARRIEDITIVRCFNVLKTDLKKLKSAEIALEWDRTCRRHGSESDGELDGDARENVDVESFDSVVDSDEELVW